MLTSGCVIKEVRVSTRMIYKKDWCGDGTDKYTGSALVSMDILLGSSCASPVSGKLRAVISCTEDPESKVVGGRDLTLSRGESLWKLSVTVPSVRLWNTWDTGEPFLYDLKLEFADAVYKDRIGMKEVSFDQKRGVLKLNRERIFLRGAAVDASSDLAAVRETGANAVIVRDELPQELYRKCDEAGLLIWRAYEIPEKAFTGDGISAYLEKVHADAVRIMNHASHGFWSVEMADPVSRTADRYNAWNVFANAVYETVRSVDPAKETIFENKAVKRMQAVFRSERLAELDPRDLKLPALIPCAGISEKPLTEECPALERWAVRYLRIRKYDPVSAVFARHVPAAGDGMLNPVLVAFEPGYAQKAPVCGAETEAGKSFTSRIWAINDLHRRIDDVRLFWSITEKESGTVRAGNTFRLHLNADSAEIPDHAIFVTNEEDRGKAFVLSAVLDTDEGVLAEDRMEISVV